MPSSLKWFHHDASHSRTCARLIARYGWEGYGRYMCLLELASAAPSQLIADDAEWLELELGMGADEIGVFMADLVTYGLMREVDGGWKSPVIDASAASYARIVARNKANAQRRWEKK